MKLPNWFKISWWLFLLGLTSYFLFGRFPDLIAGKANSYDAVAFVIWIALALVPIFVEINIFGFKLKQEIQDFKKDIGQQINALQTEVRTSVRTEFNPHINLPYPPPDSQLPDIEAHVRSAVENVFRERGLTSSQAQIPEMDVDDNVKFLFSVRFSLERELRRIWDVAAKEGWIAHPIRVKARRYQTVGKMVQTLMESEMLKSDLASAIREVYAICSPAVHGEDISGAQVDFVREIAPGLIAALRSIN